jgi:hypothetical protein
LPIQRVSTKRAHVAVAETRAFLEEVNNPILKRRKRFVSFRMQGGIMSAIREYFRLGFGALLLRDETYTKMRDDSQRLVKGLVLILLVGVITRSSAARWRGAWRQILAR